MSHEETLEIAVKYAAQLPNVDLSAIEDGIKLRRLHREVERDIETMLAKWGMHPTHMETLEFLYYYRGRTMTPADLADEVVLTRSAMTSILDSLQRAGYVTRGPHPHDRRMLAIELTPSGLQFAERHLPEKYSLLQRLVGSLSPEERKSMLEVYAKILQVIKGISEEHA